MLFLSLKSISFDKLMSLCIIMAMTAVIAPLLLLFSLRYGIVLKELSALENNPNNLEIKMLSGYELDNSFFKALSENPHTGFVIELTRALSLTCNLKSQNAFKANVEAIPTKDGDPLVLFSYINHSLKNDEVFLSFNLADDLKVKSGDRVKVAISRTVNSQRENSALYFKVAGVLKKGATSRSLIYMTLDSIVAMEDYRDGYNPKIFSDGSNLNSQRTSFARARIYAKSLDDVEPLSKFLRQSFLIKDESLAIENVKAINRVLNMVFMVIAFVSVTGGAIALSGLIFANLNRNLKSLALLRLMGYTPFKIYSFVILGNLILSCASYLLALFFYGAGKTFFNIYFAKNLDGSCISLLSYEHILNGFLLTLMITFFISIVSVRFKVLKQSIADTLRED